MVSVVYHASLNVACIHFGVIQLIIYKILVNGVAYFLIKLKCYMKKKHLIFSLCRGCHGN